MNMREETVKRVISRQTNWIMGGYLNDLDDGDIERIPSIEEVKSEIYTEVMRTKKLEVAGGFFPVQRDIRFLTTKRINELIDERFKKELIYFEETIEDELERQNEV